MRSNLFSGRALGAAMIALLGAMFTSACTAQDNPTRQTVTIRGGQGGLIVLPDTTPAPASYALTGEQSPSRQAQQAWQRQAGPVLTVGNARIVMPDSR